MKKLLIAIVIVVALIASAAVGSALFIKSKGGYYKAPVIPVCTPNASELLGYINQERAKLGAPQLTIDTALAVSSQNKLQDMVNGHYYGHLLLDGSEPWVFIRNQGVKALVGEDIDINALSPALDWQAFKNSPAHYKSLTNARFTRVGISTECIAYPIEHSTGPDDNSKLVGTTSKELTVVHLAAPEPVVQTPAPQYTPTNSRTICTYYPAVETVPARSVCN